MQKQHDADTVTICNQMEELKNAREQNRTLNEGIENAHRLLEQERAQHQAAFARWDDEAQKRIAEMQQLTRQLKSLKQELYRTAEISRMREDQLYGLRNVVEKLTALNEAAHRYATECAEGIRALESKDSEPAL